MNRQHEIEPYWQDEDDWLCTVEFLPRDDPEGRLFAADIVGYLFGYAQLTNTRVLALVGDLDASAYELLFSFSSLAEKKEFLNLHWTGEITSCYRQSGSYLVRHLNRDVKCDTTSTDSA